MDPGVGGCSQWQLSSLQSYLLQCPDEAHRDPLHAHTAVRVAGVGVGEPSHAQVPTTCGLGGLCPWLSWRTWGQNQGWVHPAQLERSCAWFLELAGKGHCPGAGVLEGAAGRREQSSPRLPRALSPASGQGAPWLEDLTTLGVSMACSWELHPHQILCRGRSHFFSSPITSFMAETC